jgi:phage baseplate assembly protein W
MPSQYREVWSDLHHEIIADALGGLKKVINLDAVKTSINNILLTGKGERVFLPQFGGGIQNLLFEPLDETMASQIANMVKDAIETWDPRVKCQGVDTQIYSDDNYAKITVRYSIIGYSEIFSTTVSLVP